MWETIWHATKTGGSKTQWNLKTRFLPRDNAPDVTDGLFIVAIFFSNLRKPHCWVVSYIKVDTILMGPIYTQPTLSVLKHAQFRDRGATLRLGVGVRGGGGGGTISDSILGGGGHKTPFLTNSL